MSRGDTLINLKNGHLEDDMAPGDTVLDGMGALALGDEEDYGYFGKLHSFEMFLRGPALLMKF